LYNGLQERRTNHRGDITCHAKLARVDIKALYGNQNIVRFLIVHQMQNTNVLAYFVPQMAGCVLNIGLKRILDTVRKDSYASTAGMKSDLVDIERLSHYNVRLR